MNRASRVALLAGIATLASVAPAWGHGYYVDDDVVASGNCESIQTACKTIADAMAKPEQDPLSGDVIVVAPGSYNENVVLDNPGGRSLVASSTSTPGAHVIEPANPADPTVEITGPSDIVGFTIGGEHPVVVDGPGRVLLDSFTGAGVADGDPHVLLAPGAGAAMVDHNTFVDDGVGNQVAVEVGPGLSGSPAILANDLSGFWHGVEAFSGTPRIDNNVIAGPSPPSSVGIVVDGAAGATISGDLIVDRETGLSATATSVTATNVTAFDNAAADIALLGAAALTLNSSIVESPIAVSGVGNSCAISFSVGPASPPSPAPCESFQAPNTNPGFIDPGAGDYRLTASSPLVDLGDPAAPPQGAVDLDGEQRAVAGTCGAAVVRDIGADEFVPDCPTSPPPPPVDPPAEPPAAVPDSDRPETSIERTRIDGRSASFRFSSDEPGSTFLCKMGRRPFRSCESPTRYGSLDRGRHLFRVKAVDAAKNTDSTPARKRFRIGR